MENRFERSEALIGKDGQQKLNNSHVAVFGLGGVGSYVVEALARAGVKELTVVDSDVYEITNLNRQLYATTKTIGVKKTTATSERVKIISPNTKVNEVDGFITESDTLGIDFSAFSYVINGGIHKHPAVTENENMIKC